ncbi:MAG: hypothetical protein PHN80_06320 [Hespellia sp.]|nr:hypothetical protein [Hespellia sp.]
MPNRILKESICRSDSVDQLSWFEEVLFYRLIVNCDDYGRYDGRPAIIKGSCFPLKDLKPAEIEKALNNLSTAGLLIGYECQGKPYLQLVTWERHQNIRAKKSKYPAFDETCIQLYSDGCNSPRNPIQSNSKSNTESNPNSSERLAPPPIPPEPSVITMTLNSGAEYSVYQKDVEEWIELYPAVDVMQCLRSMKGWLNANPTKRKTEKGIRRFINTWLQKEQDSGGTKGYVKPQGGSRVEQFAASAREWASE